MNNRLNKITAEILQNDFNYVIQYYGITEYCVHIDNPDSPTRNVKRFAVTYQSKYANMCPYIRETWTLNNLFKLTTFRERLFNICWHAHLPAAVFTE
jgi:hypothetical protein